MAAHGCHLCTFCWLFLSFLGLCTCLRVQTHELPSTSSALTPTLLGVSFPLVLCWPCFLASDPSCDLFSVFGASDSLALTAPKCHVGAAQSFFIRWMAFQHGHSCPTPWRLVVLSPHLSPLMSSGACCSRVGPRELIPWLPVPVSCLCPAPPLGTSVHAATCWDPSPSCPRSSLCAHPTSCLSEDTVTFTLKFNAALLHHVIYCFSV